MEKNNLKLSEINNDLKPGYFDLNKLDNKPEILFIDNIELLSKLEDLEDLIGIDTESFTRFNKSEIAIMQIADKNKICVIDM